jgi:hypothetical protein
MKQEIFIICVYHNDTEYYVYKAFENDYRLSTNFYHAVFNKDVDFAILLMNYLKKKMWQDSKWYVKTGEIKIGDVSPIQTYSGK